MTQQELLEYNKRCAEFLGARYIGKKGFLNWEYYEHDLFKRKEWSNQLQDEIEISNISINSMSFHSDWNWIMEIIEAIEKKSKHIILGTDLYDSFDIGNRNIKFYFSPNNEYLLQLELKQLVPDEPWIHTMYKHHIIQQFDFKNKGKKEAVVEAINQFLIWYSNANTNK